MDLYQRQQFDFFLMTATERYTLRLQERFRGPGPALEKLSQGAESPEIGLGDFVDAVFQDFLLDNPAGACFVLQALHRRAVPEIHAENVEQWLVQSAKALFTDLLLQKSIEVLQQQSTYQSVNMGDH